MPPNFWIHSCWFNASFWVVGFAFSLFLGAKAPEIFVSSKDREGKPWAWHVHQFLLNFAGSVSGWVALWFIVRNVAFVIAAHTATAPQLSDAALFFLAFLGITGYLPFAVLTSVNAIRELIAKIPGLGK